MNPLRYSEDELLNAELGVTEQPFFISRATELQLATYRLFAQAKRRVDIFSYDLDPRVLSDRNIESAISSLARKSRYSEIRLLVFSTRQLQSYDHRLVSLSQQLSSFITIRELAKDFEQTPFAFYLVDDCGLIYRPNHSEYTAQVYFNEKLKVAEYRKQFEDMWQHSRIASELRALSL
jgi:hypothetical protein